MSARDADVLCESLRRDDGVHNVVLYSYDPKRMNNVGVRLSSKNYTQLKDERRKLRDVVWKVGGSNDARHHWFLYTTIDGAIRYRDENGQAVSRQGEYVVYRTKKAATEALKRVNA